MEKSRLPKPGSIQVVPSLLSADFAKLADEIKVIEDAGVEMVHLDVMDGHFVPNITIGPPVVEKLRKYSKLVFDAHLMITNPEKYAEIFIKAGADHITFHIEVTDNPVPLIDKIHSLGATAGLCLNPETKVENIEPYIEYCDMILVMTVHPGFGAQEFMPEPAKKIEKIKNITGGNTRIEVDGGINPQTTPGVVASGADTLVAGNSIFGRKDRLAAINDIRKAAE